MPGFPQSKSLCSSWLTGRQEPANSALFSAGTLAAPRCPPHRHSFLSPSLGAVLRHRLWYPFRYAMSCLVLEDVTAWRLQQGFVLDTASGLPICCRVHLPSRQPLPRMRRCCTQTQGLPGSLIWQSPSSKFSAVGNVASLRAAQFPSNGAGQLTVGRLWAAMAGKIGGVPPGHSLMQQMPDIFEKEN